MFPSAIIKSHNPLYEYERQQIRWFSNPRHLKRFTVVVLLLALVTALVLAFGFNVNLRFLPRRFSPIPGFMSTISTLSSSFGILLGLYYMYVPIRSLTQDVNSGKWDGLRLTLIGEENLVKAKYAVAQARVWRLMILFMAFQIVVTILNYNYFRYVPEAAMPYWIGTRLIMFLQAVVQPLWIMQALTAIGVGLGLQVRNQGLTILGIFLCVVCIQLIQLYIGSWVTYIVRPLFFTPYSYSNFQVQNAAFQLIVPTVSLFASYGLFKLLKRIGLFVAFRAAHTAEGDNYSDS